ncbi:MAG: aminotransferase class I/II-fold pyridoxal phosphate-dependent enzyme [Peptostreptococcaceae bacterium]
MNFIGDKYKNIKMNALIAAGDSINSGNDVIDLSVGDHDILTDQRIINAAAENKVINHTLYTHPLGDAKFRNMIVNYIKEDFNCNININNIIVTIGAGHALYLGLKEIVNEGDEIIIIAPYYPSYIDQIHAANGNVVVVNTKVENNFIPTIKEIKEKISPRTKAIIINSPNNPTGAIYPKELLEDLYKLSIQKKFMILSDEVYTAFTYDNNKFISMLDVDKNLTNTAIFKSMSKDYAMTGWRVGYMIASEEMINIARYINDGITYSAPTICQEGSIKALQLRDEIFNSIKNIYNERIKYCVDRANKIKNIKVEPPKGCIYLFINVEKIKLSGEEFSKKLLENGVHVLQGDIFGEEYKNYVRLTCNKSVKILKEAFDIIEKVCEE